MKRPWPRWTIPGSLTLAFSLLALDPAIETVGMRSAAHAQGGSIPAGTPFVVLPAADFNVAVGPTKYARGHISRSCDGFACSFVHGLQVPNLSQVVGIELDGCDQDDSNSWRVSVNQYSHHEAVPGIVLLILETDAGSGSPCQFFRTIPLTPKVIDQFSNMYIVRVGSHQLTQGPPPGMDLRFQAVRVFYEPGSGRVVPTFGTTSPLNE